MKKAWKCLMDLVVWKWLAYGIYSHQHTRRTINTWHFVTDLNKIDDTLFKLLNKYSSTCGNTITIPVMFASFSHVIHLWLSVGLEKLSKSEWLTELSFWSKWGKTLFPHLHRYQKGYTHTLATCIFELLSDQNGLKPCKGRHSQLRPIWHDITIFRRFGLKKL